MSQYQVNQITDNPMVNASFASERRTAREVASALLDYIAEQRSDIYGEESFRPAYSVSKFHSAVRSLCTHNVGEAGIQLLGEAAIHSKLTPKRLRILSSAIRSLAPYVENPRVWAALSQAMLAYDTSETPGCELMHRIAGAVTKPTALDRGAKELILRYLAPSAKDIVENHSDLRHSQYSHQHYLQTKHCRFTEAVSSYFIAARDHALSMKHVEGGAVLTEYGVKLIARNVHDSQQMQGVLKIYQDLLKRPQVPGLSRRLQAAVEASMRCWLQADNTLDSDEHSVEGYRLLVEHLGSQDLAEEVRQFALQAGEQDEHAAALILQYSILKLIAADISTELLEPMTTTLMAILSSNTFCLSGKQERATTCIEFLRALSARDEQSEYVGLQIALLGELASTPDLFPRYFTSTNGAEAAFIVALCNDKERARSFFDRILFDGEMRAKPLSSSVTLLEHERDSRFARRHDELLLISAIPTEMHSYLIWRLEENPSNLAKLLLDRGGALLNHLYYRSPKLLDSLLDGLATYPKGLQECITLPSINRKYSEKKLSFIAIGLTSPSEGVLDEEQVWNRMNQAELDKLEQLNLVVSSKLLEALSIEEGYAQTLCQTVTRSLTSSGRYVKHFPKLSDLEGMKALADVYGKVCTFASSVSNDSTTPEQLLPLFDNIIKKEGGDWKEIAKRFADRPIRDFAHIGDLCKAAATWLVLPQVYLKLPEKIRDELSTTHWDDLSNASLLNTAQALFSSRSLSQILALSDAWHSKIELVADRMRDVAESGSWKPFLKSRYVEVSEGDFEGWKLINLTTSEELKREGRELDHCVGSYSNYTKSGKTHILSIRNPQNIPQSTAELSIAFDSKDLPNVSVRQHHGRRNGPASPEAQELLAWLRAQIQSGELEINRPPFGEVFADSDEVITPAVRYIGFVPSAERAQQAFECFGQELRAGRRAYIIPGSYRQGSVQEFFRGSGLDQVVDRLVKQVQPKSS